MPRRFHRDLALGSVLGALLLSGCTTPAASTVRVPRYEPDQQVKSRAHANRLEPLVIEWPAAARAGLETQLRRGVVAVRYQSDTIEVLDGCRIEGGYTYAATNVHHDRLVIDNRDELMAQLPLGAARLSTELEQSGRLEVLLTVVGSYGVDRSTVEVGAAEGCERATHFVAALSAGAFELAAGGHGAIGAEAGALGLGASGRSRTERQLLQRAGDIEACGAADPDDEAPPRGCGALVRVTLAAIQRAEPSPVFPMPVTPGPESEPPVAPAETEPLGPRASEPSAPAQTSAPPGPPARSSTGGDTVPASFWDDHGTTVLAVGTLAALIGGLFVAGYVIKANSTEAPRGDAPTGGLGSFTLGKGAGVHW